MTEASQTQYDIDDAVAAAEVIADLISVTYERVVEMDFDPALMREQGKLISLLLTSGDLCRKLADQIDAFPRPYHQK